MLILKPYSIPDSAVSVPKGSYHPVHISASSGHFPTHKKKETRTRHQPTLTNFQNYAPTSKQGAPCRCHHRKQTPKFVQSAAWHGSSDSVSIWTNTPLRSSGLVAPLDLTWTWRPARVSKGVVAKSVPEKLWDRTHKVGCRGEGRRDPGGIFRTTLSF